MKLEPTQQWQAGEAAFPLTSAATWAEPNPFYDHLLAAARRHFDHAGNVTLVDALGEDGTLIGRLPLTISNRHGRFPVRHVANWVYPHCYYGAPLLARGREREGWRALLAHIDAADWSGAFLHLRLVDANGPATAALHALCASEHRHIVEIARYERAMLHSPLSAEAYWTQTVRAKKRKELRRLQNRFADHGRITRARLTDGTDLSRWCGEFLALESAGWKGDEGTALGSNPADRGFFQDLCATAFASGALDMLRIDCDGHAVAMLVNFVDSGGAFSFKIAIDPAFARFSPGVLIEQDNLSRILDDRCAAWMDSCAAPDHPMIDSLWAERRTIAQYRVALKKPGLRGIKDRGYRSGIAGIESITRQWRRIAP